MLEPALPAIGVPHSCDFGQSQEHHNEEACQEGHDQEGHGKKEKKPHGSETRQRWQIGGPGVFKSRAFEIKLDRRLLNVPAEAAAAMLCCRSPDTTGLSRVMPRKNRRQESNFRTLFRFPSNPRVVVENVTAPMARAFILAQNASRGHAVFMMDQSKIRDGRECLMIFIRFGKRAIPFVWLAAGTRGSIGFGTPGKLLEVFRTMLPEGVNVLFTADRLCGFRKLIGYCRRQNWQYELRMRDSMHVHCKGRKLKTGDIPDEFPDGLENCRLGTPYGTATSIAVVRGREQKEAWIIAMDGEPSRGKAGQCGQRQGMGSMFSDPETRRFSITDTRLETAGRIERLIPVAAVAMHHAVSIGMEPERDPPRRTERKAERSRLPIFTAGTGRISSAVLYGQHFPLIRTFLESLDVLEKPLVLATQAVGRTGMRAPGRTA